MSALATTNAYTDIYTSNAKGVALQIAGTFSGTISFTASADGTNFVPLLLYPANSGTAATTSTTANIYHGPLYGVSVIRATMTAYTSGSADVMGRVTK
jgi:hypothetical protein